MPPSPAFVDAGGLADGAAQIKLGATTAGWDAANKDALTLHSSTRETGQMLTYISRNTG